MRLFIIVFVLLTSCNSNPVQPENSRIGENEDTMETIARDTPDPVSNCYWKIMQRDTLVALLVQTGNQITGKLSFDNFQKDGSSGSVEGTLEDNILKLWYTFQSEGMTSVMEIWFRKQGESLVRGLGPTAVKNDTSYFIDHSSINFTAGQVWQKTSCDSIPAKYK